jgi:hypothetical protein
VRTSLAVAACVSAAFVGGVLWLAIRAGEERAQPAAASDLAAALVAQPIAPLAEPAAQAPDATVAGGRREPSASERRTRVGDVDVLETWVQVIEHESRRPIAGARVARQRGNLDPPFVTGGACDANGWLRLRVPPGDESAWEASAFGYGNALLTPEPGHDDWAHGQTIELEPGASLAVTIISPSERRFGEVELRLTTPASGVARDVATANSGLDDVVRTTTDAYGRALIENLTPHVGLRLSAAIPDASGRERIEVAALAPGERRELTWLVADAIDVAGTLVDEHDTPLGGSEVWLLPRDRQRDHQSKRVLAPDDAPFARATTDGGGRFLFRAVALGDWWIGPGAVDGHAHDRARELPAIAEAVEVFPHAPSFEVVVRVERGSSIKGRVVDAEHAEVSIRCADAASNNRSEPTNADGSFELRPLARGSYELVGIDANSRASSPAVYVQAGARDVVLHVGWGATIRGRTIDASSKQPLAGEVLLLIHDEGSGALGVKSASATPDFELLGIKAGEYDLIARAGDDRLAVLPALVLSQGDVVERTLELPRCARLHLSNWTSPNMLPYRVRFGGAVLAEGTLSPGGTTTAFAPPGRVRVELGQRWSAVQPVREFELASDEEIELELGEQ